MPVTINGTTGIAGVDGSASTPSYQGTDTNTGIFYPAADTIAFAEGGAEVARFDSSGNLGIGTTSPTSGSVLDVASGTTTYPRVRSTIGSAAALFFQNSDTGTTTSDGMYVGITGAEEGVIWNNENTDLRIATNNTERVRITSAGDFQFNSGYGSVATAYGCRAWVNFNGTGTVAIRASGNVTSITDNGVGLYTVNFTNALPDTNYSVIGSIRRNNGSSGENNANVNVLVRGLPAYTTAFTTTAVQIVSTIVSSEGAYDADYIAVAIFR